jgi:hypothetical protein
LAPTPSSKTAVCASFGTEPREHFDKRGLVTLSFAFAAHQLVFAIAASLPDPLGSLSNLVKSLSCLCCSIILIASNAVVFLVHSTGFISPRDTNSTPQLKQNPWFERFKELGQIQNVPLGQNLEGIHHYEDAEGDLAAVHFRGKDQGDRFALRPIPVCYRFGVPARWRAAFARFRAESCPKPAGQPRPGTHCDRQP